MYMLPPQLAGALMKYTKRKRPVPSPVIFFCLLLITAALSACGQSEDDHAHGKGEHSSTDKINNASIASNADDHHYGSSDIAKLDSTTHADENGDQLLPQVTVYKSASCGCCQKWVEYLEEDGFSVVAVNHDDMNGIKAKLGIKNPQLQSCHTATIGNYVIEGHVPVSDIRRLLSEKPALAGLTAPGMPMLSPGMNSIEPKDYDVLGFRKDGSSTVFSSY